MNQKIITPVTIVLLLVTQIHCVSDRMASQQEPSGLHQKKEIPISSDSAALYVTVEGSTARFENARFSAIARDGILISLRNKFTGQEHILADQKDSNDLFSAILYPQGATPAGGFHLLSDLTYPDENKLPFGAASSCRQIASNAVEWLFTPQDSEVRVQFTLDSVSGDLIVSQQATSTRAGFHRLRWALTNLYPDFDLIFPVSGGIRLKKEHDNLKNDYLIWPMYLNAQFVILQGCESGLWVRSDDTNYTFKGIRLDRRDSAVGLAFDTEANAPFDSITKMESVNWRINTYAGDWQVPVSQYRQWMKDNYKSYQNVPDWVRQIKLIIWNMPLEQSILEELAQVMDPCEILVGMCSYRTKPWGQYWPDYTPTKKAAEFLAACKKLGFRTNLWINHYQVNLDHPLYEKFKDRQLRDPINKTLLPTWFPNTSYINPADPEFRNMLIDEVVECIDQLGARPDAIFLDESVCVYQTDRGLINGLNPLQGNLKLHQELCERLPGIVLTGEGINEVTCRYESFAMFHCLGGNWKPGYRWSVPKENIPLLCPVGSMLFADYTELAGFWGADGLDDYSLTNVKAYEKLNLFPMLNIPASQPAPGVFAEPFKLLPLNPALQKIVDQAKSRP